MEHDRCGGVAHGSVILGGTENASFARIKSVAMQTLLAIECSSNINAVAYIHDIDRPDVWVGELSREDVKASTWLLPAIERVLVKAGVRKTDVKMVAFGAGPGSFTGVRTACATAQALAYSWHASLVAVDCLEALAEASGLAAVDVVLDARMNELYAASFTRSAGGELIRISDTVLAGAGAFVAREGAALIGSGAHLVASASATSSIAAEDRWAYGVARVAIAKFARGELTDPQYAEPLYVRNNVAQTEAQRAAPALLGTRA